MTKRAENFQLKRIYAPQESSDGARVLIDRLWPRGIRKDEAGLTLWLKDIAPSNELRRWFGHDPARWEEFSNRYREELAANQGPVKQLRDMLKQGTVTLLYAAHDTAHNHALVLADYLCQEK